MGRAISPPTFFIATAGIGELLATKLNAISSRGELRDYSWTNTGASAAAQLTYGRSVDLCSLRCHSVHIAMRTYVRLRSSME